MVSNIYMVSMLDLPTELSHLAHSLGGGPVVVKCLNKTCGTGDPETLWCVPATAAKQLRYWASSCQVLDGQSGCHIDRIWHGGRGRGLVPFIWLLDQSHTIHLAHRTK